MTEPRAVLDASTLVGRLLRARGLDRGAVDEILSDGVLMTAINWSETISALYKRAGWSPEKTAGRLRALEILGDVIRIVPFGESEAHATAVAHRELIDAGAAKENPGIADVSCLALARSLDLPVVTSDERWTTFAPILGVRIQYFEIPRPRRRG